MKFVPSGVSSKVARVALKTKKGSPTILFAAGIVGVVGTVVLSSRATLKLSEVLDETKNNIDLATNLEHANYSEADRKKDLVYIKVQAASKITKLYGPSVILGALSVAALTGSHRTLTKRNAAVVAAYAALDEGFKKYRERVAEAYGPERERELRYGVEKCEMTNETTGKKKIESKITRDSCSIYAKFFDSTNRNWANEPSYNFLFLRCQQNTANDLLKSRGHVFLNDVYDSLGLERTSAGAVTGWVKGGDGDQYIDFGIFNGPADNSVYDFVTGLEDCILLDFNVDGVIYDKI